MTTTLSVAKSLFEDNDAKTTFLTQEALSSQTFVYNLISREIQPKMLTWATRVLERICAPAAPTMQISSAKQFTITLSAVTSSIQDNAEKYSTSWLSAVRDLQKKREITPEQSSLAMRARNVTSMFLSHFLLLHWQMAAMFSLFLSIVEREVFSDHEAKRKNTLYNSFYICEDGYSGEYKRALRDISIAEQVEHKLEHACFGRHLIWAHTLYTEMKEHLDKANIDPRVLYLPVYLRMNASKRDSLPSVLEFFMRMLYVSTVNSISQVLDRETKKGITTVQNPQDYVGKYFSISLALLQHSLLAVPTKRAKLSDDDDNDAIDAQQEDDEEAVRAYQEELSRFTEKRRAELCEGLLCSPACLPHPRTTSMQLEVTQHLSIFSMLDASNGSLFGDVQTSRESSRCLWVVWLQNVEKLYQIYQDNEKEAKTGAKSQLGTLNDRLLAMQSLLACTPKPNAFICIMTMLQRSIEQHHASLLKEVGFDLNRYGLIDQLFTHIGDLCNFYAIVNCTVHEQQFIENKNK